MSFTRRRFLASNFLAAAGLACGDVRARERHAVDAAELDRILNAPVLKLDFATRPVTIASVELLRNGRTSLVRVRSADGLEVVTVPNEDKMPLAYPHFLKNVAPVFVGKDARGLEALIREAYRHRSNYKLQGLVHGVAIAAIEAAVLALLAESAGKPLAELFGGRVRQDIDVYFASGNRGNRPEEEIEHLQKLVAGSGVKALKFRLGGRMSRNVDVPAGRTEALIPLARKTFGDDFVLYGDANSSYDVAHAVRIGRSMEENGYAFYEEPCEFDDLWGTKEVADTLEIPVAGGEQEYSLHRWKWTILNRGVDIVQPDIHYGGGMLRAVQVAKMAAAAGLTVVPHMSGGGLGYVDVVQFASFTPNVGPYMEFKGNAALPVVCPTSSLRCEHGRVRCPSGPGFGVTLDPEFVRAAKIVNVG